MAEFDGCIEIDRAASAVFDVVGTRLFETQPKWEDGIVAIRPLTEGPMRVGSLAKMERLDLFVWRHTTTYQCMVFDQDRLVVMHNDSPGTHVVSRLSMVPVGRRGTLLRFHVEVDLAGTMRLLEPVARVVLRARQKTLRDIKAYVEANTT
jgi:hypothetical protein